MGDLHLFHLFIYSIIYLNQHGLTDLYFILWVIIQYYIICLVKLIQIWPLGTLSVDCGVPLIHPHYFVCVHVYLSTSLFSSTLRFILYWFGPIPRTSHFSKKPWSLLLENGIRNKDLDTSYTHCYLSFIASRSSQLTEQENVYVYANLCIRISINIYICNHPCLY